MYKQAGGNILLILRVISIARLLIHSPLCVIKRSDLHNLRDILQMLRFDHQLIRHIFGKPIYYHHYCLLALTLKRQGLSKKLAHEIRIDTIRYKYLGSLRGCAIRAHILFLNESKDIHTYCNLFFHS